MIPPQKGQTVPILLTMDKILRYLAEHKRLVALKEICQTLEIPRSTASRILATLNQLGYLEKDGQKPAYRLLHSSLLGRSIEAQHYEVLRQAAEGPLKELAQKLGETAKLSVWDSKSCSVEVLCSEIGNNQMHIQVPVGIHFPWHAGAASKLLMAFDEGIFKEILKNQTAKLEVYTQHTITDMSTLQVELEKVRKDAWAYDKQEYQEGIEAIACPVFCSETRLLGALSIPHIASPAIRERIYKEKKQLLNCAEQIGKQYAVRMAKK